MMNPNSKIRVAVLYGGRSGEHEISLRSAASVIRNLNRDRFEVIPIAIDKAGKWHLNQLDLLRNEAGPLPVFEDSPELLFPTTPATSTVLMGKHSSEAPLMVEPFDVVFPVMHGPLCEDGTIQGLFELTETAYVGSGVLGSAVGMDKDVAKRLARDAGIPIVPFITVRMRQWARDSQSLQKQVEAELGFPCFVKPANLGSSVGVYKVKEPSGLNTALENAFRFDEKVLIEKAIDAREIEYAVLESAEEGKEPELSVPGEITPTHEFYSYEAKYLDENGAHLIIPASITEAQAEEGKQIARKAFQVLECQGLARVDLFLDRKSGEFYFNEVNTMPGFTEISMYPKLWGASGVSYSDLLSRLIDVALLRHQKKKKLVREFLEPKES